LLDWSRDVTAFADRVGLGTFSVSGWSGGGPYVLACALAISERLTGAAVLSGCGPLDTPAARRTSSDLDRTMLALSTRAPLAARVLLKPAVVAARRTPKLAVKSIEQDFSKRDVETFRRLNPDAKPAMGFFLEAFRSGTAGVIDDYRVLASPWGFEPEAIDMHVDFWHGDEDRMVAMLEAQAVANRMANASFTVVPGAGHLLFMDHLPDVFTALARFALGHGPQNAGQIGRDVNGICCKQSDDNDDQQPPWKSLPEILGQSSPRHLADSSAHHLNGGHQWPRQECGPKKLGSKLCARNRIGRNAGWVIVGSPGNDARPNRSQQQSYPSNWGKCRHERGGVCTLPANLSANPLTILHVAPYKLSVQSDPM
jgi:pimeloyl-ACP methyl ester carboxylesterase